MPNECMHYDFKQIIYTELHKLRKGRQNMVSIYRPIQETTKAFPKEEVPRQINKLPDVFDVIDAKKGGRTKFWDLVKQIL